MAASLYSFSPKLYSSFHSRWQTSGYARAMSATMEKKTNMRSTGTPAKSTTMALRELI